MGFVKTQISKIKRKDYYQLSLLILFSLLGLVALFWKSIGHVSIGNPLLFGMFVFSFLFKLSRTLHEWVLLLSVKTPEPCPLLKDFSVDVLTTWMPGEPVELVKQNLKAITKISYPHTSVLCAEAFDEELSAYCDEVGVRYIVREGENIGAKAGNVNHALKHLTGEIVVILDPDHEVHPDFLDEVLPYFQDEKIGFVQTVQAYKNKFVNWVTRAAAQETYLFYGPLMMGLNRLGAVQAIGANCTFRRAALEQIGGHATGLTEDYNTTIQLQAKGWRSVYLPKVLTKGLVPYDLNSYVHQQLKWTKGVFDVFTTTYLKSFKDLSWSQRLQYLTIPVYFSRGWVYLLDFLLVFLCLVLSDVPLLFEAKIVAFLLLPFLILLSGVRIKSQDFYLEEDEKGFRWSALLMNLNLWWVNCWGIFLSVQKKNLPYIPTSKEQVVTRTKRVFLLPNLALILLGSVAIAFGLYRDWSPYSLFFASVMYAIVSVQILGVVLSVSSTFVKDESESMLVTSNKWLWGKVKKLALVGAAFLTVVIVLFFQVDQVVSHYRKKLLTDDKKIKNHYWGCYLDEEQNYTWGDSVKNHNLISVYSGWDSLSIQEVKPALLQTVLQNKIPLWTIEPWTKTNNETVFKDLLRGDYDTCLTRIAATLSVLDSPCFIRFGHEPNNPLYPWFNADSTHATSYRDAFKYFVRFLENQGVGNATFVYTPWGSNKIDAYYPGEEHVDWVGLNILDYNYLKFKKAKPFTHYYDELRPVVLSFQKPVLICELAAPAVNPKQQQWLQSAVKSMNEDYPEIKGAVLFTKENDANLPSVLGEKVSWKTRCDVMPVIGKNQKLQKLTTKNSDRKKFDLSELKGVVYNTNNDWQDFEKPSTRRQLEKDFAAIKAMGANTIRLLGHNFYTRNVLQVSQEMGLNVNLTVHLPANFDYLDTVKTKELEQQVVSEISQYENYKNLRIISLGEETWGELSMYNHPPELFIIRRAYLNFITQVSNSLEEKYPGRFYYTTILGLGKNAQLLEKMFKDCAGFDFLSFNVRGQAELTKLNNLHCNLPFCVSGLGMQRNLRNTQSINIYTDETFNYNYFNIEPNSEEKCEFLTNAISETNSLEHCMGSYVYAWSDMMKDSFTWNGLVDYRGRKKASYRAVQQIWAKRENSGEFDFNIKSGRDVYFPGRNYAFTLEGNLPSEFETEWIVSDDHGVVIPEYEMEEVTDTTWRLPIHEDEQRNLRLCCFVTSKADKSKVWTASQYLQIDAPYRRSSFWEQFLEKLADWKISQN